MSDAVDVGAVEDFEDGVFRVLEANGRQVGVVRVGEEFHALRNICPHQSAPLCAGQVMPAIGSAGVGGLRAEEGKLVVACPWHGWEFSITDGESAWDPKYRVRSYPVLVENGRVKVEMSR